MNNKHENKEKYGEVFSVRLPANKANRLWEYIQIRLEPTNDILTEAIDFYLDRKTGEQPLFEVDLMRF